MKQRQGERCERTTEVWKPLEAFDEGRASLKGGQPPIALGRHKELFHVQDGPFDEGEAWRRRRAVPSPIALGRHRELSHFQDGPFDEGGGRR